MHLYSYEGPVLSFGKTIQGWWLAETKAVSPAKARSNLSYRFKKEHGFAKNAKIELIGYLKEVH